MAILANFRKNVNIVEMLAVKKKTLLCGRGKIVVNKNRVIASESVSF